MRIIIELMIRFHIVVFLLMWIYVLSYPIINKLFKLKSNYKMTLNGLIKVLFVSIIPILNVFALYMAFQEDIRLYNESHNK